MNQSETPFHTAAVSPFKTWAPPTWTFATQRNGRLLTIGTAFETSTKRNFGKLSEAKLEALAYFNAACAEPACAAGKLVIVDQVERSVRVFQTGKRQATPVYCGNAVAAGVVILAHLEWGRSISFQVGCENCLLPAEAHITLVENLFHVAQRWLLPREWTFEGIILSDGWRALRVRGPLNPYLLVEAPADFDPRPILSAALGDDSLSARAAVITRAGGLPRVHFYSLERRHGGAPQTGLVTLALAAREVGWVREIFAEHAVEHPLGYEPLPELHFRDQAILCELPPVLVGITNSTGEDEA